jgi:hypothetical protein
MITNVFGYPVGIFEPFTPEEVSKIRNEMGEYLQQEVGQSVLKSTDWNANCLTSSPDGHGFEHKNRHPFIKNDSVIIQTIQDTLTEYLCKLGLKDSIQQPVMFRCGNVDCTGCERDCWVNVYREGHNQEMHWHHGEGDGKDVAECVFGFVYFLKYDPEKDAKFIYVNPAPNIPVPGFDKCPAFQRETILDVKEGTLMFFPSFMLHRVSTQGSGERITIAGNFFCKSYV